MFNIIYIFIIYCTGCIYNIFMLNLRYWLIIYFYLRVKVFDITVTDNRCLHGVWIPHLYPIYTPSYKLKNLYIYSIIFVKTAQNKIIWTSIYLLKLQYKNAVFKNIQKFEFVFLKLYRN